MPWKLVVPDALKPHTSSRENRPVTVFPGPCAARVARRSSSSPRICARALSISSRRVPMISTELCAADRRPVVARTSPTWARKVAMSLAASDWDFALEFAMLSTSDWTSRRADSCAVRAASLAASSLILRKRSMCASIVTWSFSLSRDSVSSTRCATVSSDISTRWWSMSTSARVAARDLTACSSWMVRLRSPSVFASTRWPSSVILASTHCSTWRKASSGMPALGADALS
mmetsp:Transcript_15525/g.47356  ORF Transcript_15525/g.47356 Transcript_15525/m.47356 type:complete len:231 (+) Transcript_15525:681-1373(+)